MFSQIKFENFRGFRELDLQGLKRVNLIVGKNNSGKTSLLEGISLLADPNRNPMLPTLFRESQGQPNEQYYKWLVRDSAQENTMLIGRAGSRSHEIIFRPGLLQNYVNKTAFFLGGLSACKSEPYQSIACGVMPVNAIGQGQIVKIFGAAMRQKDGEDQLEHILKVVDNRIKKIRIDPDPENHLVVDVGLSELIPLTQTGQGVNRLVAIFSQLIGERDKIFLIDEIENGLHHSTLQDVWTGIAEAAEHLDVQVFATTHSYECIEAASAAFERRTTYDFSVIRLFRVENAMQGDVLDREHIEAALAGNIDLRGY